jgi:succinate-semialdehyde dehydrogenase/glutarate-semialdehyde dehydrogenase
MVGANHLVIAAAEIPFGGIKKSGSGGEGRSKGIETYAVAKYVNTLL